MTIIFPDTNEITPMCLADGYLPEAKNLDNYLEKARETLPSFKPYDANLGYGSEGKYSELIEMVRSATFPKSEDIQHYMIFNKSSDNRTKELMNISNHFEKLLLDKDYSIHIIINENFDNEGRENEFRDLEQYVTVWNSMSGFKSKGEKTYGNFDSHIEESQKLLKEIQEVYCIPRIDNLLKTNFSSSLYRDLSL